MNPRIAFLCLLLCPWLPLSAEDTMDSADDNDAVFERIATLSICFDFGCNSRQDVYIHTPEWLSVEALLSESTNADEERVRIGEAVAYMERIVGSMSPTGRDLGGNEYPVENAAGQMDCIDESKNTTSYLLLFQNRGLLKWHRVIARVYRAPQILDQHWAAGIEEVSSGEQFAVDSWFKDNGEPPYIQKVDAWKQKIALGR